MVSCVCSVPWRREANLPHGVVRPLCPISLLWSREDSLSYMTKPGPARQSECDILQFYPIALGYAFLPRHRLRGRSLARPPIVAAYSVGRPETAKYRHQLRFGWSNSVVSVRRGVLRRVACVCRWRCMDSCAVGFRLGGHERRFAVTDVVGLLPLGFGRLITIPCREPSTCLSPFMTPMRHEISSGQRKEQQ